MKLGHDLLASAIEEQRPIVLLLGQDAWAEPANPDTVLISALNRLERSGGAARGWSGLLSGTPAPESFYDWLAERFERRVPPAWLAVLSELPWSAVFTSTVDQTLGRLFAGHGREPEAVLTSNETPRAVRSRARPPLYYLFGRAGSSDQNARPPISRSDLNTRRIAHALPLLGRLMDTATTLGLVVIDGVAVGRDWLKLEDILGAVGKAAPHQVLWFGGRPESLGPEDASDFDSAVASGRIVVESARLGTAVAEMLSLGRIPELALPDSEESGVVSLGNGKQLETTPEERLRVEAVASIVDDTWTAFLPPLGPDAEYAAFRRFHGDMGGTRLLVEGARRGFAIEREFEGGLLRTIQSAVANHASIDTPIMVHGQSGTGKSVALARIVAQIREKKIAPVLYSIGRIPQSQEISSFCEAAEHSGAEATLIVCDANRDVESYRDLLLSLRSRGRRAVVVGSRYRISDGDGRQSPWNIEAPTELTATERQKLADLLARHVAERPDPEAFIDAHILGFLYRFLPPSRPRISAGLGAEALATEQAIRERGRQNRPVMPDTQLAQKLIEAGFNGGYQPLFDSQQTDVLEANVLRAPDDGEAAIADLRRRIERAWPAHEFDRIVSDATTRFGMSIDARKFREPRLGRWRTFLESIAEGDDPELQMTRMIERDLLDHAALVLPIDGRDVMSALGLDPGPAVARALHRAREMFRSGIIDRDELLRALVDVGEPELQTHDLSGRAK